MFMNFFRFFSFALGKARMLIPEYRRLKQEVWLWPVKYNFVLNGMRRSIC